MQLRMNRIRIEIRPEFLIGLCLCFLLIPIKWIAAWLIAAAVHECAHLLCVKLLGGRVEKISVWGSGAQIRAQVCGKGRSFLCVLAGPLSGLLLLIFAECFPRVAVCGLIQSIFNMLPIYPLDGQKLLLGVLTNIFGRLRGAYISNLISRVVLLLIFIAALYCAVVLRVGFLPVGAAGILLIRQNNPCKHGVQKVQ